MTTVFAIVTSDDRAEGIEAHGAYCPIGRAATRAVRTVTGRQDVVAVAAYDTIRVILRDSVDYNGRRYHYFDVPTTDEVVVFMTMFDRDDAGQYRIDHLSFPIEIPENLPPPNRRLVT
jgi:hypothetical protein